MKGIHELRRSVMSSRQNRMVLSILFVRNGKLSPTKPAQRVDGQWARRILFILLAAGLSGGAEPFAFLEPGDLSARATVRAVSQRAFTAGLSAALLPPAWPAHQLVVRRRTAAPALSITTTLSLLPRPDADSQSARRKLDLFPQQGRLRGPVQNRPVTADGFRRASCRANRGFPLP